jgi:hypothetical protein
MKAKHIFLSMILVLTVTAVMVVSFWVDPVDTKEKAVEIAVAYVNDKYPDRFSNYEEYEINVELEEDTWIVFYTKKGEEYAYILGGGGPCVKINRHTGIVFYCKLQK